MSDKKTNTEGMFSYLKVSFGDHKSALLRKYNFLVQGLCPQKINYFYVYT